MLIVDDLHAYYGDSHVLQGVGLRVEAGQVCALLGRNGAGKTTTIKTIIGEVRPRRGRVSVAGQDLAGAPPERIARAGVGLVPQGRGIFPALTVRENLLFAARPGGAWPEAARPQAARPQAAQPQAARPKAAWSEDRVYELFPRLRERLGHRGNQLSGGEQQVLAIGRALLTNPRVLLMDEPSEGLAPLLVREIGRVIEHLKSAGMTILLVEQNLTMALAVADHVAVLSKGQIVYQASPDALRREEHVMRTYLGV
jgi:branched-chain amino acid transport system ATP-binding protein